MNKITLAAATKSVLGAGMSAADTRKALDEIVKAFSDEEPDDDDLPMADRLRRQRTVVADEITSAA